MPSERRGKIRPTHELQRGACEVSQIPRSESPAERAEMLRLADYHFCKFKYYQARW
jgi:hypothetical protein